MRKVILVLAILIQASFILDVSACFVKPRVKLNHDVTDDSLIMALDSGKEFIVEFHNVALCGNDECYNILEVGDSLKDTIKVIGYDTIDKLDKGDHQAHHTIKVKRNAKPVTGYVTLKDADTKKVLNKIKVMVRGDEYCFEETNRVQGEVTFPDGDSYIMNFNNMCELENSGATLYEKN